MSKGIDDVIRCPYCGEEMEEGYIPADRLPVQWVPKESKYPLTVFSLAKGAVRLTAANYIGGRKAVSYYCEGCNVVITPVPKF